MFRIDDNLPEIVVSDGYKLARSIMKSEWNWTPQRIKDAIIVCREIDLPRVRNLDGAYLYIAEYPENFDRIHDVVRDSRFIVGNPRMGSIIDPAFFTE